MITVWMENGDSVIQSALEAGQIMWTPYLGYINISYK